jgi:hypothetical protein
MDDGTLNHALAAVYALQPTAPAVASPIYWQCGGWRAVLVEDGEDAGEFVGYEHPRRPQIISRRIVVTAVTALKRYRRLSPMQLMSLELSVVDDVVTDEYRLASVEMQDDYGFILEAGAGYRLTVRSIADCVMSHVWSPVAALAWSRGQSGMGALGEAVARVRSLESVVRES